MQLLPHFDCYLIGSHPRDRLVPAAWAKRALTRGSIGNVPLVVVDGVVAGVWRQELKARQVEVRVEMSEPLTDDQYRTLEAGIARIGEIMEAEVALALDDVEARPHL